MTDADDISIRLANRGDVDAIHDMIMALARATAEESKIKSSPLDFMTYGFGANPLFEAMIAERAGSPVGLCLFFYSFSTWLGEPGIYVQDLYVSEQERGRGLGRRLLAATVEYGHDRKATHLRLSVYSWNTEAKHFYDRIGMEYRDQEDSYHLGGDAFLALAGADR